MREPDVVRTCGNCINALKPDEGMYTDETVCLCRESGEFVKTTYETAWDKPHGCDNWDWEEAPFTWRYYE